MSESQEELLRAELAHWVQEAEAWKETAKAALMQLQRLKIQMALKEELDDKERRKEK